MLTEGDVEAADASTHWCGQRTLDLDEARSHGFEGCFW